MDNNRSSKTDQYKKKLTQEQYNVCFPKGTEPAFSGKYYGNHELGIYVCVVCGQELFSSDTNFESGTGWSSFWDAVDQSKIKKVEDKNWGMIRTEVICSKCGAHLGHVFDDGPKSLPDGRQAPGKRYCINSLALDIKPQK